MLLDEQPLLVNPSLAKAIGLNESIILQQVHYWLKKSKHNYDGRDWVYNTYEDWQKQFPFWCLRTIKSIISKLRTENLLIIGNYNKLKIDRTLWYSINYEKYHQIELKVHSAEVALSESAKVALSESAKVAPPLPFTTPLTNPLNTYSEYTTNLELIESITAFIEMRKSLKKPMTDKAVKMMLKKLDGFTNNETVKIEILNQSTMSSWIDIYELKQQKLFGKQEQPKTVMDKAKEAAERYAIRHGITTSNSNERSISVIEERH